MHDSSLCCFGLFVPFLKLLLARFVEDWALQSLLGAFATLLFLRIVVCLYVHPDGELCLQLIDILRKRRVIHGRRVCLFQEVWQREDQLALFGSSGGWASSVA
jgi:hypothetical protein